MKKLFVTLSVIAVCTFVIAPVSVIAQEDGKGHDTEMMENMMTMMSPGDHHKQMSAMEGTFKAKVKSWMEPGADPIMSEGTTVNSMILGGRFLMQEYNGAFEMGGQTMDFAGHGLTGFDNTSKKYQSVWIDNFGTVMLFMSGTMKGNEITMTGTHPNPTGDGESMMKAVTTIKNDDIHTYEMWTTYGSSDEMVKMMEITYTRSNDEGDKVSAN